MVFVDRTTPVSETDFLSQDPPVAHQNYACISYVSPEALLARKDAFMADRFRKQTMGELSMLLEKLCSEFPDDDVGYMIGAVRSKHFVAASAAADEKKAEGGWSTTVRGLKVRGVYETLDDAQTRASQLKKIDKEYDVFVAEVGCWCQWHPDPSQIGEKQYTNPQENAIFKSRASHPDMFES